MSASADGGAFGQIPGLSIRVDTAAGLPVAFYAIDDATTETAFVFGEFYRRTPAASATFAPFTHQGRGKQTVRCGPTVPPGWVLV